MKVSEIEISYKPVIKEIDQPLITGSSIAVEIFRQHWDNDFHIRESFYMLLLNRGNRVKGCVNISKGSVSGTLVDPKLVFSIALKTLASNIILGHNHPSGNLKPSQADKSLTNKLVKGGDILDIKVLDHVILTEDSYFSFADESLI